MALAISNVRVAVALPADAATLAAQEDESSLNGGVFYSVRYDNGTEISINLLDPSAPPIVAHGLTASDAPVPGSDRDPTISASAKASRRRKQAAEAAALSLRGHGRAAARSLDSSAAEAEFQRIVKRGVSCWQYLLSTVDCDNAFWHINDFLHGHPNGYLLETGNNNKAWVPGWSNTARVYLCINGPNHAWRVYNRDVDKGQYEMDHTCRLYEAGYYWDSRYTQRLMGKAHINSQLGCL